MKRRSAQTQIEYDDVATLRSSIIHTLKPLSENPELIEIGKIEIDETNPGSKSASLRYQRRAESIHDSFDIFSKNIYPIIVCQHPKKPGWFIHVDGYGRLGESKARGFKKISAIIYPPMSLEERILFRQTLNAAQEPFDATSIINDLWELAKERNLDITNKENIEILVRDLPAKVRKHKKDLLLLAQWHPQAVSLLGESYKQDGKTIGIDKFRQLDSIVTTIEERHPKAFQKLGGTRGLTLKLANMYVDRKFSEGTRSQEAIRDVTRILKSLDEDDKSVLDFFVKQKSVGELSQAAKYKREGSSTNSSLDTGGKDQIVESCKALTKILLEIDSESLSVNERRVLSRTATVLDQVLHGAS